jgi:hypothetical protein
VLGETYMMLDLGNARSGQFLTPYHVSHLMAGLLMGGRIDAARSRDFERIHEPACGAGGMVIATAEAFHDAGLNYQEAMHATCIDIDPCCVHMAYLQLSLLHIPAIVVHGNALSMEVWGHWFTPAHVLGGWSHRLRARKAADAMRELMGITEGTPEEDAAVLPAVDVTPPTNNFNEVELGVVAVLERPRAETLDVADMFEEAIATLPASRSIFEVVDQLTLF